MSDKIREALAGMLAIVDDSRGVDGYHLNGAIAEWDEFPEVEAARAALAQQPAPAAPEGWRPIETAPKNGVEIILRKGDRVTSGAWAEWSESYPEFHGTTGAWLGNVEYESGATWASWDGGFAEGDEPEYWIPLPTSSAPAAPVAVGQEPVAWSDGQCREFVSVALRHVDVKGALHAQDIRDGLEYMAARGAGVHVVLGIPPAAEQPDTVKVPRETAIALLDDGPRHETWLAQDALRAILAGGEA